MADKLDLLGLQTVLAQADDQIHQAFWPIDETQTAAIFQQPGCCCRPRPACIQTLSEWNPGYCRPGNRVDYQRPNRSFRERTRHESAVNPPDGWKSAIPDRFSDSHPTPAHRQQQAAITGDCIGRIRCTEQQRHCASAAAKICNPAVPRWAGKIRQQQCICGQFEGLIGILA